MYSVVRLATCHNSILHRDTCAGKYSHLEILEISLINESGQTERENAKHTC